MRRSFTKLYVHLIRSTWDRLELIAPEIETEIHHVIDRKCSEINCSLEAIGSTSDHIHILVRIPSSISVGHLVHRIKGASSHYISRIINPAGFFKWQGGYSAFSVSPFYISAISRYIENQKKHHRDMSLRENWEFKR